MENEAVREHTLYSATELRVTGATALPLCLFALGCTIYTCLIHKDNTLEKNIYNTSSAVLGCISLMLCSLSAYGVYHYSKNVPDKCDVARELALGFFVFITAASIIATMLVSFTYDKRLGLSYGLPICLISTLLSTCLFLESKRRVADLLLAHGVVVGIEDPNARLEAPLIHSAAAIENV